MSGRIHPQFALWIRFAIVRGAFLPALAALAATSSWAADAPPGEFGGAFTAPAGTTLALQDARAACKADSRHLYLLLELHPLPAR